MALAIPPKNREEDYGVFPCWELSDTECRDLIELHSDDKNPMLRGRVQRDGSNVTDMVRQTDVYVVHEDNQWVDELVIAAALAANDLFKFQISGLIERPQLLRYTAPNGGYDWHLDIGNGDHSTRKISLSFLLNDNYEGGELCFFTSGEMCARADKGVCLAFPSFLPHKVNPVTKGERWALVAWITGEPYR